MRSIGILQAKWTWWGICSTLCVLIRLYFISGLYFPIYFTSLKTVDASSQLKATDVFLYIFRCQKSYSEMNQCDLL